MKSVDRKWRSSSSPFVIPFVFKIGKHLFEIYTLVSEIQQSMDLIFGVKNMFEIEEEVSCRTSQFKFLNRSLPFLPWNFPQWDDPPLPPWNLPFDLGYPLPCSLLKRPPLGLNPSLPPLCLGLVMYGL